MQHKKCIEKAKSILKKAGIDTYALDSEILMEYILKVDKINLFLNDYNLSSQEENLYFKYIEERQQQKPIAYILKEKEFMGLNFYVDENVLIPRPDTEILIEKSIEIIQKNKLKTFLDIGSGSGCIAISLSHYTKIDGTSTDIYENNLQIGRKNAKINNIDNINFLLSNLFENINSKYDLIISNPPYIEREEFENLGKNVTAYEPHSALFANNNGLYFYEEICNKAKEYLEDNGFLAFEIGYNQKEAVVNLMKENNFTNIVTYKDYGNNNRVVIGQLLT